MNRSLLGNISIGKVPEVMTGDYVTGKLPKVGAYATGNLTSMKLPQLYYKMLYDIQKPTNYGAIVQVPRYNLGRAGK